MSREILCGKCETPMTKGHFVPDFGVGSLGVGWTDQVNFSKWKIETVKKIPTFQYRCPECGIIETYSEMKDGEPGKSGG